MFDVHHTGHGNAISVSGFPILMQLDEMKQNLKSNGRPMPPNRPKH